MKINERAAGGLKSPSRGRNADGRALAAWPACGPKEPQSQERARHKAVARASTAHREMTMESHTQLCLEQLAGRGMRQPVDEDDVVGNLPLRQLFGQELEERGFRGLRPLAGMDDQKWALLPDRMLDCDDRGLEHVGMRHGEVLDVDRGNPLAAGLDDVLQPVGELDEAVRVDRAHVARAEPAVLVDRSRALALEIAGNHPVSPHLQFPDRNAVVRQVGPIAAGELEVDAEYLTALPDLHVDEFARA